MNTRTCKAKVYICKDCGNSYTNYKSHNAHRRHCGNIKGWINSYGYKMIFVRGRGEVREHRYIMEKHLGRFLTECEHIHHLNGDRLDNRLENLELIDIVTHGSISGKLAKGVPKPNLIGNKNGCKRN